MNNCCIQAAGTWLTFSADECEVEVRMQNKLLNSIYKPQSSHQSIGEESNVDFVFASVTYYNAKGTIARSAEEK